MSSTIPTTTRAVRFDGPGARSATLRDVPLRPLGAGEVLIDIAYAGICHTDIHFLDGEFSARMTGENTLGHEVSGTVVASGTDVTSVVIGDRVIVHPVIDDHGRTEVMGSHWDGGWADFMIAAEGSLVRFSAAIPFEQATILADAVSCPWAAISTTGDLRAGESVAVWGLGGLGYHAVKLLRMIGAGPIVAVDPNRNARERALEAGADHALDPMSDGFVEALASVVGPAGVDAAFDFVGVPAVHQQAFDAIRRGGRLILVGMPTAPFSLASTPDIIRLQKRILGHYGMEKRHIEELVRFVELGRLDLAGSVSEVLPLDQWTLAVEHLRHQVNDPIRILLQP